MGIIKVYYKGIHSMTIMSYRGMHKEIICGHNNDMPQGYPYGTSLDKIMIIPSFVPVLPALMESGTYAYEISSRMGHKNFGAISV